MQQLIHSNTAFRGTLALFCLCLPASGLMALESEYEVEINGKIIPPEFFSAYAEFHLDPDMDCYGFRDQHILSYGIGTRLILEAGRAKELEENGEEDVEIVNALNDVLSADRDEKRSAARVLFAEKGAEYRSNLMEEVTRSDGRALHAQMLKDKHPLLTNATYVRTFQLKFDTRTEASAMLSQLTDEQSFEQASIDLGQTNERYVEGRTQWLHEAVFPSHGRQHSNAPQVGDVIGPFYSQLSWQIRLVLDTKTQPIVEFSDDIYGGSGDMGTSLTFSLWDKSLDNLMASLWNNASVKINGEDVPTVLEADCSEDSFVIP